MSKREFICNVIANLLTHTATYKQVSSHCDASSIKGINHIQPASCFL